MQIDFQQYLPYFESAGAIAFFDIEATGTKSDYNSLLVGTVKPWHKKPSSYVVTQPGHDVKAVRLFRDELEKYPILCGYYSKGFDMPFLQGRLLHHGLAPLSKHHHLDLYFQLKSKVLTARRSQAHLLEWLDLENQKMTLSPSIWNMEKPKEELAILVKRCESDCAGLENLFDRVKHLLVDVVKG